MYQVIETDRVPIKAWTHGVPVEDAAVNQLRNVASLPFVYKHVAAMPDVHWGMGATVGSVIATKGAVIPAAVGVDIGCGMVAGRLSLTANDLQTIYPAFVARSKPLSRMAVPIMEALTTEGLGVTPLPTFYIISGIGEAIL